MYHTPFFGLGYYGMELFFGFGRNYRGPALGGKRRMQKAQNRKSTGFFNSGNWRGELCGAGGYCGILNKSLLSLV